MKFHLYFVVLELYLLALLELGNWGHNFFLLLLLFIFNSSTVNFNAECGEVGV